MAYRPPNQYGQPGAYGAPPPQQHAYGAPPQQAYGAPPPQAYGAPPAQQGYGGYAPGYGQPPQVSAVYDYSSRPV